MGERIRRPHRGRNRARPGGSRARPNRRSIMGVPAAPQGQNQMFLEQLIRGRCSQRNQVYASAGTEGSFERSCPQWSLQKRPTVVRAKPANGDGPELGPFIPFSPDRASLFLSSNSAAPFGRRLQPIVRPGPLRRPARSWHCLTPCPADLPAAAAKSACGPEH